jgi:hypothetical protein
LLVRIALHSDPLLAWIRPLELQVISGQVEWQDSHGTRLATSEFTLQGAIPAGEPVTFSKASGTLECGAVEGAAATLKVKFNHASIVAFR